MQARLFLKDNSNLWVFATRPFVGAAIEVSIPDREVVPRIGLPVLIADSKERYPIRLELLIPRRDLTVEALNDPGEPKRRLGASLDLYADHNKMLVYVLLRDAARLVGCGGPAYRGWLTEAEEGCRALFYRNATANIALIDGGPARYEFLLDLDGAWVADLETALAGDNNDLRYTAKKYADITIAYDDPGPSQPLYFTVVEHAITIYLATAPGGAILTTSADIKQLIENAPDPAARALVEVNHKWGNNGSGVVTTMLPPALVPLGWGTEDPAVAGVTWDSTR